jgi:hypothetical protein
MGLTSGEGLAEGLGSGVGFSPGLGSTLDEDWEPGSGLVSERGNQQGPGWGAESVSAWGLCRIEPRQSRCCIA